MRAGGISGSTFAAIVTGVRGELNARLMRDVLGTAEILDQNLDEGFRAVEATAHQLTETGVAVAKHEVLGSLLDVVG